MITVQELKAKTSARYESTLKKLLLGENPFPVSIPYKRLRMGGDPAEILRIKQLLRNEAKETVGFGPTVQFEAVNTRRYGAATVPGKIEFTSLDDLTRYIGKMAEANSILDHAAIITDEFPAARTWTSSRLQLLSGRNEETWLAITKIVKHFIGHPKPWVYPRELSLGLPTKFLEQNYGPVIDLLGRVFKIKK